LKAVSDSNYLYEIRKAVAECSAFSYMPTFDLERQLIARGHALIAGVDEAGRGSLAGPLCVGLVMYSPPFILSPKGLSGVNDSKRLSHAKRVAALDLIVMHSLAATSILVSHHTIDRMNINGATEFALTKLLEGMTVRPDVILLDGNFSFKAQVPIISIPKGDCRSISIASASIVAKVRRDRILDKLDVLYPGFYFGKNKGYGTRRHIKAIYEKGFTPLHRKTYEPVKSLIVRGDGP
jgi:ribonuclease HII